MLIIELKLSIGLRKFTNFTSYKDISELFARMALSTLLFAINVVLYIVRLLLLITRVHTLPASTKGKDNISIN